MRSNSFFISVIVPVYNGESFLREAIESIHRQDHRPGEIIIVDDGSTDGTSVIASEFPDVRYVYQPNGGPASARNAGLRLARGNIICFLDADDIWSPNKLAHQFSCMMADPSVDIVIGLSQLTRQTRLLDGKRKFESYLDPRLMLNLGATMMRKSAFHTVGLFDETLRYTEDWDWFMRARELNVGTTVLKQVVQFHRRHDQNITNQADLGNQYAIRMIKMSLDRRRRRGNGLAASLPKLPGQEKLNAPPAVRDVTTPAQVDGQTTRKRHNPRL